jgi:hypothetical protein
MVRIAISVEAFEAIAWAFPVSSVGYEAGPTSRASAPSRWNRSGSTGSARCEPGESYSDVILRIAGQEALATRRG